MGDKCQDTGGVAMTGLQKALAALGLLVALVAGGVIGTAGIGHKYGAWNFDFAWSTLIRYGFIAAVAGGALALLGLVIGLLRGKLGGFFTALIAIAVAAGVAYVPWTMREKAASLPAITDITTDFDNPPQFVALANMREMSESGSAYKPENAAKQEQAYPDIATLVTPQSVPAVFGKASAAIKKLGWTLAEAVPDQGRIEATSVSEWFGFKEDVVVRIVPEGSGARVDIRSASRAASTDFGANAEHVRALIAAMK